MTGNFALTLPVMLAVALASTVSRALSYGTIYTTKLLRRGTDIDRAAPWRALQDMNVASAMRRFRPVLQVPPASDGTAPDWAALAGPVTRRLDPQSVFATESLAQTLRQLEVYGRDGLPVLSADGHQVEGWVTNTSVLRAIKEQISGARPEEAPADQPPAPLAGYELVEITVDSGSPAAGARLETIAWPPGTMPVSVQRDHRNREARPTMTLPGLSGQAAWHRAGCAG
ncbi:MAG: hypothetical protein ACRDOB_20590 [Streptosporangiaceae bacterium]